MIHTALCVFGARELFALENGREGFNCSASGLCMLLDPLVELGSSFCHRRSENCLGRSCQFVECGSERLCGGEEVRVGVWG